MVDQENTQMLEDVCNRLHLSKESCMSFHSFLGLLREGFSITTLSDTARCLGSRPDEVAKLLGTTEKQLLRNRTGRLSCRQSDHLCWMITTFSDLSRYEGGDEKAQKWLHQASLQFGGEAPLSYFDTVSGIMAVSEAINCLRYGMTA